LFVTGRGIFAVEGSAKRFVVAIRKWAFAIKSLTAMKVARYRRQF
jgi:hypothetical protein